MIARKPEPPLLPRSIPLPIDRASLSAAQAAIEDQQYAQYCLDENRKWSEFLVTRLNKIGIQTQKSFANFVLAEFKDTAQADAANARLQENGILVRQVGDYNLPHCLRITVGLGSDCERIIAI